VIGAGEFLEVEPVARGFVVIMLASEERREAAAEAFGLVEICAGTSLVRSSWCCSRPSVRRNIFKPSPATPSNSPSP
jgi:hypothetical protein